MFKIEVDEKILNQAVKLAINSDIIPVEGFPGHGVQLRDYIEYTVEDAIELGVMLSEKTAEGKPRFHWHSDIRADEHEDVEIAIMTPLIKAAIEYYLKKIAEK